MKKRICNLLGHKWRYNFPTMPNKKICKRCKMRGEWLLTMECWSEGFQDVRSNQELIEKWVRLPKTS